MHGRQENDIACVKSFAQGILRHFVEWNEELENRILIERFLKALKGGENYITALKIFGEEELNEKQYEILMVKDRIIWNFQRKSEVLYAISRSMKYQSVTFHGASYDLVEQKCFSEIQKMLFQKSFIRHAADYKIAKEVVQIKLPVRVNWAAAGRILRHTAMKTEE